jgi:hypothetical protein
MKNFEKFELTSFPRLLLGSVLVIYLVSVLCFCFICLCSVSWTQCCLCLRIVHSWLPFRFLQAFVFWVLKRILLYFNQGSSVIVQESCYLFTPFVRLYTNPAPIFRLLLSYKQYSPCFNPFAYFPFTFYRLLSRWLLVNLTVVRLSRA